MFFFSFLAKGDSCGVNDDSTGISDAVCFQVLSGLTQVTLDKEKEEYAF